MQPQDVEKLIRNGEEGLHEKLHAAQSYIDHIRQENAAMIRRAQTASAARVLRELGKSQRLG